MTAEELYTNIYKIKNEDLKRQLTLSTEMKHLDRKELLFRQDEYDNMLCFLGSGVAISYEIESSGRTVCLSIFNRPGEVITGGLGPIDTYSPFNIEMQDTGEVFCIPISKIEEFIQKYPECVSVYNEILMYEYKKQRQINKMLHYESKEKRYEWFLHQYPELVNIVNHKTIASFLSMSPVTLSRIRSKRNRN